MPKYTQTIDTNSHSTIILKDGQPLTIERVLAELNRSIVDRIIVEYNEKKEDGSFHNDHPIVQICAEIDAYRGLNPDKFLASIAEMDSLIEDLEWVLKTSGKEGKIRPVLEKAKQIREGNQS